MHRLCTELAYLHSIRPCVGLDLFPAYRAFVELKGAVSACEEVAAGHKYCRYLLGHANFAHEIVGNGNFLELWRSSSRLLLGELLEFLGLLHEVVSHDQAQVRAEGEMLGMLSPRQIVLVPAFERASALEAVHLVADALIVESSFS